MRLLLRSGVDLLAQMPLASEGLHRLVPSFSLSMIRVDESCTPREHYSEYFDETSHRLFAEHGHMLAVQNDDPASFGNLLRRKVPYGNLLRISDEYLSGAIYQHFFARNGIHHVLDVAVRDAEGPLGILGIFREEKAPNFERSDVLVMRELYDDLVHAFRAEPLPADFDEAKSAILLTSPTGKITWATPEARLWLADAFGGRERAGLELRGDLPEACRVLTRRVARGEEPTLCLPVAGGRLRLRAYPMEANENLPGTSAPVAILLRLEMHRTLRVLRALGESKLSPQQRRMALGYFRGARPAEVAAELGVTASTLKSYQKDLYLRLGVTSQQELVARLHAQAESVAFDLERHRPRRDAS